MAMKRILLLLTAMVMISGNLFARVDRYKTDKDADKTKNHITYQLPFHFGKDRTNLVGTYTLATNIGGKQSGTLHFEFVETENELSKEIRKNALRIAKDIHDSETPTISMSLVLANGETFTFDGSYFSDWTKNEWGQLLHVTYNKETSEYRTFIMFPLEFLKSNKRDLSSKSAARYKYMLKVLGSSNINKIVITDIHKYANIKIEIPIDRPTAETIADMVKK